MISQEIAKKITLASILLLLLAAITVSSDRVSAASWDPEEVIESYLKSEYPWNDIEVKNVTVKGNVRTDEPDKIIVEKGPLGRAVFTFLFTDEERSRVTASVRAFDSVVKSKRPFKKGHVINSEDIYESKMDIRKMPNSAVTNAEEVLGKYLRRSLSANVPIVENMLELSKVVKRGKRVRLVISKGALSITASGKTREKGYVGMPVKAMNLSSKKEVMGVLVDEHTVRVDL